MITLEITQGVAMLFCRHCLGIIERQRTGILQHVTGPRVDHAPQGWFEVRERPTAQSDPERKLYVVYTPTGLPVTDVTGDPVHAATMRDMYNEDPAFAFLRGGI